jgi:glycosyltransferase involved in cell wall biosynthesis
MVLGIDGLSLSVYGGFQHLLRILSYTDIIKKYGFKKVIVWGNDILIDNLTESDLIELVCIKNNDLVRRLIWQRYQLTKLAEKRCDVVFAPGGVYVSNFRPYIAMFQNMLVFDNEQLKGEGFTFLRIKTHILKYFQSNAFNNSNGLIFLSDNAKDYLYANYNNIISNSTNTIIPIGVDKNHIDINKIKYKEHNIKIPLRILYVSTIKSYKHQWKLIDAFSLLIEKGYNVQLHLIGGGDRKFINKIQKSIKILNYHREIVFYHGKMDHDEVKKYYESADIFAYLSSCENLPAIILEAMSYGLPIASSNLRPMTDIMGESALYFDHKDINSIAQTIERLINNIELRRKISHELYNKSKSYSWRLCAEQTFSFISNIAQSYNN